MDSDVHLIDAGLAVTLSALECFWKSKFCIAEVFQYLFIEKQTSAFIEQTSAFILEIQKIKTNACCVLKMAVPVHFRPIRNELCVHQIGARTGYRLDDDGFCVHQPDACIHFRYYRKNVAYVAMTLSLILKQSDKDLGLHLMNYSARFRLIISGCRGLFTSAVYSHA